MATLPLKSFRNEQRAVIGFVGKRLTTPALQSRLASDICNLRHLEDSRQLQMLEPPTAYSYTLGATRVFGRNG